LCRLVDDRWGLAFALYLLGVISFTGVGEADRVDEFLHESATLFRQLEDKRGLSLPLETLGRLAWRRGDHKAAVALWEESLALNRASGDPVGTAQASHSLVYAWLRQGEYSRAQALLQETLAVYQQLGNHFGSAYALLYLGRIAHARREYAEAKQRYAQSQTLFQGLGSKESSALFHRGRLALDEGELAQARAWLEQSLALAAEAKFVDHMVQVQMTLAMTLVAQAEHAAARALLTESLSRAHALHDNDAIAQVLCGWARLAQDEPARAVRLLGAAHGVWDALGLPVSAEMGVGYDECLRLAHSHLEDALFQAAWAEGDAMSVEQAITYALAVD
jgi:tetratricopeptide (TPR) repeat protein